MQHSVYHTVKIDITLQKNREKSSNLKLELYHAIAKNYRVK